MDWLNSLIVTSVVALLAHRLTIGRDERTARRNAQVKFRGAFLTSLSDLYPLPVNWPHDIEKALGSIFPILQTAIAEFRPFVPWWRRRAYDRAWFRYRYGTGRQIDLQNYHHYIAFGNNPDARRNFCRNVAALLRFAR